MLYNHRFMLYTNHVISMNLMTSSDFLLSTLIPPVKNTNIRCYWNNLTFAAHVKIKQWGFEQKKRTSCSSLKIYLKYNTLYNVCIGKRHILQKRSSSECFNYICVRPGADLDWCDLCESVSQNLGKIIDIIYFLINS